MRYELPWRPVKAGFLALFLGAGLAIAEWKPGENPDPQRILEEAQADARAARYEDALAKHVWFHENALKYEPAMYGVRLSFALSAWEELGAAYPPALEKLRSVRDRAASEVRTGTDARHRFHDVAAINRVLDDPTQTKDLFVWLDTNNPKLAAAVFDIAQPSLVLAKEYRLCGKYLDPDRFFERAREVHDETTSMSVDPAYRQQMRAFADKHFTNEVSTLVALLAVNDRRADAERIVAKAKAAWGDPVFHSELDKALKGEMPEPWP
jgi:hypothetical protein